MRDYGIDLAERIDGMSWRQFANLARNLSPFGAVAARVQALRGETEQEDDEGRAAAFFEEMQAAGR